MVTVAGSSRQSHPRSGSTAITREERDLLALVEQHNFAETVINGYHQIDADLALALLAQDTRDLEQTKRNRKMARHLEEEDGMDRAPARDSDPMCRPPPPGIIVDAQGARRVVGGTSGTQTPR
jgi:hypothetical protein